MDQRLAEFAAASQSRNHLSPIEDLPLGCRGGERIRSRLVQGPSTKESSLETCTNKVKNLKETGLNEEVFDSSGARRRVMYKPELRSALHAEPNARSMWLLRCGSGEQLLRITCPGDHRLLPEL